MINISKILKYFQPVVILLITFYAIYPKALAVRGSSALMALGAIGILMYVYHKLPFRKEVFQALLGFGAIYAAAYLSSYLNGTYDEFIRGFTNTQMGYFFAGFLINSLIFKWHKNPTFKILLIYIVAAVALQCIVTLIMRFNPAVNDFLFSLELQDDLDESKKNYFSKERFIGYGTAFFGSGIIAGYGLIILAFIIARVKMKLKYLLLATATYVLIFYVGLFSARTTLIGFGISLILLVFLIMFDKKSEKDQGIRMMFISAGLLVVGASLCFIYFPELTDWAFEMVYQYQNRGEVMTYSSAGIMIMFYAPDDFFTLIFGRGSFAFFGSDVGYTRLMFYIGIPGMLLYFLYPLNMIRLSLTKDFAINLLSLVILGYSMIMNIKGFTDLNLLTSMIFFFFQFYKRDVLYPKAVAHLGRSPIQSHIYKPFKYRL